jgi:hypothetical protein
MKQGKSTHGFFTVHFEPEITCTAEADTIVKSPLDKSNLVKDYTYTHPRS